jgi:hypothetical protein
MLDGANEEVALVATAVEDGEDTVVAADWLDGFGDNPPQVPLRSLTDFEIFDEHYHLVNMEEGMLESGVVLYASGQVGAVVTTDEQSKQGTGRTATKGTGQTISGTRSTTTRVEVSKLEIIMWKVAFFSDDMGRESGAGLTICTDAAEYYLIVPSEDYSPFFVALKVI